MDRIPSVHEEHISFACGLVLDHDGRSWKEPIRTFHRSVSRDLPLSKLIANEEVEASISSFSSCNRDDADQFVSFSLLRDPMIANGIPDVLRIEMVKLEFSLLMELDGVQTFLFPPFE